MAVSKWIVRVLAREIHEFHRDSYSHLLHAKVQRAEELRKLLNRLEVRFVFVWSRVVTFSAYVSLKLNEAQIIQLWVLFFTKYSQNAKWLIDTSRRDVNVRFTTMFGAFRVNWTTHWLINKAESGPSAVVPSRKLFFPPDHEYSVVPLGSGKK